MSNILRDMLTYARPMGSTTEQAFRVRYLLSLPGATLDAFGNIHVRIGDAPVLWSCHTDTVHLREGRQTIHVDTQGLARLSKRSRQQMSCLGADDTVGVWLCREMILRSVPGLYLFHYGEERGGLGSRDLAQHTPQILDGIQYAIALDRKGTSDVITYQGSRCCSDAFAQSLADGLNVSGLHYAPSSWGIYTDTAEYTGLVGECTNLSIGYEHAHTRDETCDMGFAERLLEALCALDISTLVAERKPRDVESYAYDWSSWRDTDLPYCLDGQVIDRVTEIWDECVYCGHEFDPESSTAVDEPALFCSFECECESNRLVMRYDRSTYLSPETADIQSLLYRQAAKDYLK